MKGQSLLSDMKDRERVMAVIRHHWFELFIQLLGLAILFLVPFFLIPLFWNVAVQAGSTPPIPGGVVLFFSALWTLIIWNLIFSRWTDNYFDIWIITNQRIVDIDQKGFFNRSSASLLTMDHIEDVEGRLSGVLGNIFNFGDIQVQTAAAHREFTMTNVPNPTGIANVIRDAQKEHHRLFGLNNSHNGAT